LDGIESEARAIVYLGAVLLLVVGSIVVYSYQKLRTVALKLAAEEKMAAAVVQKRAELVNRLIDIVSQYAADAGAEPIAMTSSVSGTHHKTVIALGKLNSFARTCPDLKADFAYQQLMNQIDHFAAKVQQQGQTYQGIVRQYDTLRRQMPGVLFARPFGFHGAPQLTLLAEEASVKHCDAGEKHEKID